MLLQRELSCNCIIFCCTTFLSCLSFSICLFLSLFTAAMTRLPSGMIKDSSHIIRNDIWRPQAWLLTADVEHDGVAPLSVRVLEAAVESVVAQVHLGQDQSGTFQTVLGPHIRSIHLPWHWCVIVQGATLHGNITAHSLILVPSTWKETETKTECWWHQWLCKSETPAWWNPNRKKYSHIYTVLSKLGEGG